MGVMPAFETGRMTRSSQTDNRPTEGGFPATACTNSATNRHPEPKPLNAEDAKDAEKNSPISPRSPR